MEAIDTLWKRFEKALNEVKTLEEMDALRIQFLGKKGPLQELLKSLGALPKEERPQAGQKINQLKEQMTLKIEEGLELFKKQSWEEEIKKSAVDVTLPGRNYFPSAPHPVQQVLEKVLDVMSDMGFSVQYGPHVESEYYNFDALNFPEDHPAKEMHDTFYLSPGTLLRTHTSNTQIRVMEHNKPPVRMVAPGRCFRNEDIDASHHIMFHQLEALYVDENVSFSDLLATLEEIIKKLLGSETQMRFRPSYFPFVEPGLELDILWKCGDEEKWLEILGAGMVHPNVLEAASIDSKKFTGYAFGMGIERLVLLLHGIDDIRLLTENDLRFLHQFPA